MMTKPIRPILFIYCQKWLSHCIFQETSLMLEYIKLLEIIFSHITSSINLTQGGLTSSACFWVRGNSTNPFKSYPPSRFSWKNCNFWNVDVDSGSAPNHLCPPVLRMYTCKQIYNSQRKMQETNNIRLCAAKICFPFCTSLAHAGMKFTSAGERKRMCIRNHLRRQFS